MSIKREIKCPNCSQFTLWLGRDYDRCLHCAEFLQNQEFIKKLENDIVTKVKEENDIFYIRPNDSGFTKISKRFFRRLRKITMIVQALFIGFMTFILWILGMLAT
ncbi:MAG: hypothetical protein EAZ51_03940 [Sphingobacteriales bacterium]|nr:MAG: hypothetical protein EAZ64_06610 [Sphingobacteriales bacterium]TAF81627.1 MAG: hypothetical protein EAZ51_03940 [Sphingobacteriales bacterium]